MRSDVVSTGVTLMSVGAALWATRGRERNAVRSSVRRLLSGILALLAARLWAWSGDDWAMTPLMVASSVLPVLVVLVTEQACRRHAWPWLKLLAAVGGTVFLVTTGLAGPLWPTAALAALAVFQALIGVACAAMLLGERALPEAEAGAARMLGLAFLAALPLVMTDFAASLLPVRLGAVGISLIMVALVLLARGEARPSALVRDACWCLAAAAMVCALAWATVVPLGDLSGFAVSCACAAAGLLVVRMSLTRAVSVGVVRAASRAAGGGVDDLVACHPLLSSGRVVSRSDLSLHDADAIDAIAGCGMVTRQTAPQQIRDVVREILDASDASHLLHLGGGRFLAVAAAGFAGGTMDEELMVVARLAEAKAWA